ncbi:MAG: hypothetical protein WC082_07940 [Victivallales bacterium]
MTAAHLPGEMIELSGQPQSIGKVWGEINARHINKDIKKCFLELARKAGIDERELLRRNAEFVKLCSRLAPHWLDEIVSTAHAANVKEDIYLAFCGSVYRNIFLGDECTSYSISQDASEDGRIFFHKTRDNISKSQCAFIISNTVKDVNKFIAVSDSSVITCMMMVNDKGLAGSADMMGELSVNKPSFRGMMNTHMLRYIAEKAGDCNEALEIVKEFISKKWYAGGAKTGTHWHFVDRFGKRLEISCNSEELIYKYHESKVYFSLRSQAKCARILQRAKPPINFKKFHNVSRDPSMCFNSSISGMSVEVNRKHPGLLSYAWICLPAKGLGFPLFIGGTKTPKPLFNGGVDSIFRKLAPNTKKWEKLESFNFLNQELLSKEIEKLIISGNNKQIPELINEWTMRCTYSNISAVK